MKDNFIDKDKAYWIGIKVCRLCNDQAMSINHNAICKNCRDELWANWRKSGMWCKWNEWVDAAIVAAKLEQ